MQSSIDLEYDIAAEKKDLELLSKAIESKNIGEINKLIATHTSYPIAKEYYESRLNLVNAVEEIDTIITLTKNNEDECDKLKLSLLLAVEKTSTIKDLIADCFIKAGLLAKYINDNKNQLAISNNFIYNHDNQIHQNIITKLNEFDTVFNELKKEEQAQKEAIESYTSSKHSLSSTTNEAREQSYNVLQEKLQKLERSFKYLITQNIQNAKLQLDITQAYQLKLNKDYKCYTLFKETIETYKDRIEKTNTAINYDHQLSFEGRLISAKKCREHIEQAQRNPISLLIKQKHAEYLTTLALKSAPITIAPTESKQSHSQSSSPSLDDAIKPQDAVSKPADKKSSSKDKDKKKKSKDPAISSHHATLMSSKKSSSSSKKDKKPDATNDASSSKKHKGKK